MTLVVPLFLPSSLCVQIDFTAAENIPEAHWEVRYTVDMTATRHIVEVRVNTLTPDGLKLV